jgi:hypothetical protein
MKKPGKNTSYHLLSDMTEEQYAALPEEVRRVYVSTAKKIPIDPKEKLATIQKYPQYFQKVEKKPFGQNFKRFQNLKSKMEKIKKARLDNPNLSPRRVKKVFIADKDQVSFPDPPPGFSDDGMDIGKMVKIMREMDPGCL